MNGFLVFLYVSATAIAALSFPLPVSAQSESTQSESEVVVSDVSSCPALEDAQNYDVIIFGDEVPGVMTALKVKRELRLRRQSNRVAIITEGDTNEGIGGHLVRGGLAYLDRNQVAPDLRSQYGIFGRPSRLYQEFLGLGQVDTIGLDRFIIAHNFQRTLWRSGVEVIGNVELEAVQTAGALVCAFTASGQTYAAEQFVDASQSGKLADASGVEMMQGFDALGFPDSTLSIGLVFDLYDLTIDQVKAREADLIRRLLDPNDREAQGWLDIASGNDPDKRLDLIQTLLDQRREPKLLYQGTPDSADVRSLAFSIAVHGRLGREFDLKSSGFLFDRANIAVLRDRLSFNALLFYADAKTAQELSRSGAKPNAEMQAIAAEIKTLFARVGLPRVEFMDELYIRNAGQIANPRDELSATLMSAGGISEVGALGTFAYHLDDRGGIEGFAEQISGSTLRFLNFRQMPTFNYGFRHTLPQERWNLAVLGPASGFGGLGTTAGRIVEFNVGVGEGLAIAMAMAMAENRSLHTINNLEVRQALGYTPAVYGYRTESFRAISTVETQFRAINYEQSYLDRAQTFLQQGNYADAAQELSRLIALEPTNADAYYLRGNSAANLQLFDIALADYTEAVRLNPRLVEAYQSQGLLNIYNGDYNQAIDDFEQVLQLDPQSGDAQFGKALAIALQQSALTGDDWEIGVLPLLNQSIQQEPELAVAYLMRGLAQVELGNSEEARADFEQARDLYRAQDNQVDADKAQNAIAILLD